MVDVWHKRLGHHIGLSPLKQIFGIDIKASELDNLNDFCCKSCLESKGARFPFSSTASHRAKSAVHRIHSDLLTMSEPSLSGYKYAITFVDNYTRKLWTRPL